MAYQKIKLADIRSRKARCEQLLESALALAMGCFEQLAMVFQCEVRGHEVERRKMELAVGDHSENYWIGAGQARSLGTLEAFRLRKAQTRRTIGEQARARMAEIQLAGIDFAQVAEKVREAHTLLVDDAMKSGFELRIGEVIERVISAVQVHSPSLMKSTFSLHHAFRRPAGRASPMRATVGVRCGAFASRRSGQGLAAGRGGAHRRKR